MPQAVNGIKVCCMCKEAKPVSEFGKCSQVKDGLRSRCRECRVVDSHVYYQQNKARVGAVNRKYKAAHRDEVNARGRRYYAAHHAEAVETMRRYRLKHPDRYRARNKINNNLAGGRTKKPGVCDVCGHTSARLEAHHHLGYAEDNWLKVLWLCRSCHRQADATTDHSDGLWCNPFVAPKAEASKST